MRAFQAQPQLFEHPGASGVFREAMRLHTLDVVVSKHVIDQDPGRFKATQRPYAGL